MATDAWLTLLAAAQGESSRWREALQAAGSAEALVADSPRSLAALGLGDEAIGELKSPDVPKLQRWRRWLEAPHRTLVGLGDARFPPRLAQVPDPPLALWVEGREPALLAAAQLAIVGSRNPTATGRETALQFAKYLAERGLTITSGLATGIDCASHRGAVTELGSTVAVLGSGLDVIFPREHERLAAEIATRGLLVSEYGPGTAAQKFFFPARNRIIAGLSVGTLVVEASRRSGSLITARRAIEYGREVFAIPGSIHNPLARGCHLLIRQGAKLVEEAADILVELAPQLELEVPSTPSTRGTRSASPTAVGEHGIDADETYRRLLDSLDFAPIPISQLRDRCQLTTAELSSMLLVLELEGLVEALPGGRYARLGKREQ
jgi:DNA processing protein